MSAPESSLYDRVGGQAYFVALDDRFCEHVDGDPVLRPLYPADLGPGKANLAGFLARYRGGPPDYSERHEGRRCRRARRVRRRGGGDADDRTA